MATMAAPVKRTKEAILSMYRAMRSSVDHSQYGDAKALKEEGRKVDDSLREERAAANGLLLKR